LKQDINRYPADLPATPLVPIRLSGEEPGRPSVEEIASRPAARELLQQMDFLRDGKFLRVEVRACSPVLSEIDICSSLNGGGHA
jgi:hypothetical protein